jgi:hypothetical protein
LVEPTKRRAAIGFQKALAPVDSKRHEDANPWRIASFSPLSTGTEPVTSFARKSQGLAQLDGYKRRLVNSLTGNYSGLASKKFLGRDSPRDHRGYDRGDGKSL